MVDSNEIWSKIWLSAQRYIEGPVYSRGGSVGTEVVASGQKSAAARVGARGHQERTQAVRLPRSGGPCLVRKPAALELGKLV